MSYSVDIDETRNLATVTVTGRMDVADIADALHEIIAERRVSQSHRILVDLSGYKTVPTAGEIIEISRHVFSHWRGMSNRIALLAPGGFFYDMAHLATSYISMLSECANGKALPVRVFTDSREATDWCCGE